MFLEVFYSIVVAILATILITFTSLGIAGAESKKTVYIVSAMSLVIFFILAFKYKLSDLIFNLI
jgi:hypothetical protein